jgi:hypothetical protein
MNTTTPLDGLRSDMQCFVLPYGGVGFLLDALVLHGMRFLVGNQSPWNGQKLEHQPLNIYFSSIGMCGSFAIAVYSATRCKFSRPLVLASLWRGSYVVLFNFVSIVLNYESHKTTSRKSPLGWASLFYTATSILGVVGVSRTARAGWDDTMMKIGTMNRPL